MGQIEKMWTDSSGDTKVESSRWYRPEETFHVATTTFFASEVFRSSDVFTRSLSEAVGKFWALPMKQYLAYTVKKIKEEDLYVVESRYNSKSKSFGKIKVFKDPTRAPDLKERKEPLVMRELPKKASIFAEAAGGKSTKGEDGDEAGMIDSEEVDPRCVRSAKAGSRSLGKGSVLFDVYYVGDQPITIGDFVYVRSSEQKSELANFESAPTELPVVRIDQIWSTAEGTPSFTGTEFLRPAQTKHSSSKTFYKKELIMGEARSPTSIYEIVRRCHVLHLDDFKEKLRPLPVAEEHVFVCESKYKQGGEIVPLKVIPQPTNIPSELLPNETYELATSPTLQKEPSPYAVPVAPEPLAIKSAGKAKTAKPKVAEDVEEVLDDTGGMDKELRSMRIGINKRRDEVEANLLLTGIQAAKIAIMKAGGNAADVSYISKPALKGFMGPPALPQANQLFMEDCKVAEEAANSGKSKAEVTNLLTTRWKALPSSEVQEYVKKAEELCRILRIGHNAGVAEIKSMASGFNYGQHVPNQQNNVAAAAQPVSAAEMAERTRQLVKAAELARNPQKITPSDAFTAHLIDPEVVSAAVAEAMAATSKQLEPPQVSS